jgi:hypothetical protein
MRFRHGIAAIAVAMVAGGCGLFAPSTPVDPTAAFCQALGTYAGAVLNLNALDDQNTIDEYRAAAQQVEDAFEGVVAAAVEMGEAEVDELQAATDTLVSTINDLPQDVPISDIQAELRSQVAEIAVARASLGVTVCSEPAAAPVPSAAAASPAAS